MDDSTDRRMLVYLAGPLFSEAEQFFNSRLADGLEEFAKVYLPQRDGGLMSKMVGDGISPEIAATAVFRGDMAAISQADVVLAVLDGRAIDEGVAFEIGVAYSQSKPVVGLQTDSRRLSALGNNPMISRALSMLFSSTGEAVAYLRSKASASTFGAYSHDSRQGE